MRIAGCLVAVSLAFEMLVACGGGEIGPGTSLERCDNGLDDDGDGLVDCNDQSCASSPLCSNVLAATTGPAFKVCAQSIGDRSQFPVDMIWLLDSSVSMQRELSWIANNINDMDGYLREKRANIRVVMLGGPDICVAPPLGGPNCTNGERFLHVPEKIGNQEALRMGVDLFPRYASFLRPGARRVIVAVSDDNPNPALTPEGWPDGVTADTFRQRLDALDSAFSNVVFHSIVAFAEDGGRHPNGCTGAQRLGQTYLQLTEATGGMKFSVCNNRQGEWRDFLEELATQVAGLVNVPCTYPRAVVLDNGKLSNTSEILGEAQVDGRWETLSQLPDGSACGSEHGWYVASDKEVRVCPAVCTALHVSQVRFKYGCPAGLAPY